MQIPLCTRTKSKRHLMIYDGYGLGGTPKRHMSKRPPVTRNVCLLALSLSLSLSLSLCFTLYLSLSCLS